MTLSLKARTILRQFEGYCRSRRSANWDRVQIEERAEASPAQERPSHTSDWADSQSMEVATPAQDHPLFNEWENAKRYLRGCYAFCDAIRRRYPKNHQMVKMAEGKLKDAKAALEKLKNRL
jgi:hypothetical protein